MAQGTTKERSHLMQAREVESAVAIEKLIELEAACLYYSPPFH